eukprot:8469217-Prorocentrum_lima.AAC.1
MTIHVSALRELLQKQCVRELIWCDNRDMIADPLTKAKARRHVLNIVLRNGEWVVVHEIKEWSLKHETTVEICANGSLAASPRPTSRPLGTESRATLTRPQAEPTRSARHSNEKLTGKRRSACRGSVWTWRNSSCGLRVTLASQRPTGATASWRTPKTSSTSLQGGLLEPVL